MKFTIDEDLWQMKNCGKRKIMAKEDEDCRI